MAGRKPLTDEQKQRKREKAQELRLKKKLEKANGQLKELEETKLPEPEIIENIEDPDEVQKKKMETAEKRRKALELARSKRITPTQIRKNNEEEMIKLKQEKEEEMMKLKQEKEQEMMRMKEENDKLKIIAEEKPKVKIIKKYVNTPVPIPIKKKKQQTPLPVPKQEPTMDAIAEQNYAIELKRKMRDVLMQRISSDIFG